MAAQCTQYCRAVCLQMAKLAKVTSSVLCHIFGGGSGDGTRDVVHAELCSTSESHPQPFAVFRGEMKLKRQSWAVECMPSRCKALGLVTSTGKKIWPSVQCSVSTCGQ
jgi:hypothetical protein